ncbi:MAG: isoprenyl transferase [Candidatus Omnitrophica bacterium]|nr:isoprenyl transferase [Candidatus Omnitrophota bacterium]
MTGQNNIPKHIAIIMDGNGRWAKERGLPRTAGHREGVERVREAVSACRELGVGVVTFFAFSSENWSRPKAEVQMLLRYLDTFLGREIEKLHKDNIRFKVIGRQDPIPGYLQKKLKEAQDKTRNNTGLTVVLALNYGSKQEIVDAIKSFVRDLGTGEASIDGLDTDTFSRYLYTSGLPDPDLLIRTSGESRLSNFLLWQLSYAELYFPKKYWPDFKKDDLKKAVAEYQKRDRRFGKINDGHQKNN